MASWRDVLPIHPAADLFPPMSPDALRELGEDIRANKLQFPIATWFDPMRKIELLVDGRNRLDAMEKVGLPTAEVMSYRSRLTCIDPWDFVIAANIHRRHLTAEQKRDLIAKLIKAQPEKSDRQIATTAKVDHKAVGAARAELEATGEIPQLEKTTGKDGKARKRPKKTAPPEVVEQRRQARVAKQERARKRERAKAEREEWQASVSRVAYKLLRLDIEIARDVHRTLMEGGDTQLMDDLAAGIEIEQSDASAGAATLTDAEKLHAAKIKVVGLESEIEDLRRERSMLLAEIAQLQRTPELSAPNKDGLDIPECLRRGAP